MCSSYAQVTCIPIFFGIEAERVYVLQLFTEYEMQVNNAGQSCGSPGIAGVLKVTRITRPHPRTQYLLALETTYSVASHTLTTQPWNVFYKSHL